MTTAIDERALDPRHQATKALARACRDRHATWQAWQVFDVAANDVARMCAASVNRNLSGPAIAVWAQAFELLRRRQMRALDMALGVRGVAA